MEKLENWHRYKVDFALYHVQSGRSGLHCLYFCAIKSDLHLIIVRAYERGERQVDVFRRLEQDGVSEQIISYTIKRWRETGGITDRSRSGRRSTACTRELLQRIRCRVRRRGR